MHRLTIAVVAALVAALIVVSLSAAAPPADARHAPLPHRIISLSPTVTEDLFAIGAGKQVVAVDNQSNYPKRAPQTTLSGYSPNVEAIANYHPDLVLISYNPSNFASQLRQLGIKVVFEAAATNLKQAYGEILRLGRLTGHNRGAKAVVRSMRRHLAAIVASVPTTRRHLRVYHELDPTYYSATSNTFIGSIYKLFGFRDIADAAGGPAAATRSSRASTSSRRTRRSSSSRTRGAAGSRTRRVSARPGWSTISAVQHHRVVAANDDVASRWGPRIVQFARSVARIAKQG